MPSNRRNLMEAVLGDVTATIPLDLWESHIDRVKQDKLANLFSFF